MSIISNDTKILKSAVNSDTSDGGGAMTGNVLTGVSNEIFPDTSDQSRATGRIEMRKVFGVAHSTDNDALLGAMAYLTKPPSDANVHATLFQTPNWGDMRADAKALVERYLVKGPRAPVRIFDQHYIGSQVLQLYMIGNGNFPAAGDVVVLTNPARLDSTEQFVRVQNVKITTQDMTIVEGGTPKDVIVRIARYDLEQSLKIDIYGPPVCRVFSGDGVQAEDYYAKIYTSSIAASAKFYGVKPLVSNAAAGDFSLDCGDIFSALVPAVTTGSAVTDQQPTASQSMLIESGTSPISISSVQTNYFLQLPTPAAPLSLSVNTYSNSSIYGAVDDGNGNIYKDTMLLATIEYQSGLITFKALEYYTVYGGNIGFGAGVTYKQAVLVECDIITTELQITVANQSLTYVTLLNPLPVAGTLRVEYVAQGRWYSLAADALGRISGGAGYGSGSVSKTTGSMSLTLGALPDIGSSIVLSWGANTTTIKPTGLPTELETELDIGFDVYPVSRTLSWTDRIGSGTVRTATVSPSGVISGDATGRFTSQSKFTFSPSKFPNASGITLAYQDFSGAALSDFTLITPTSFQLSISTSTIAPGTVFFTVIYGNDVMDVHDDGTGELWGAIPKTSTPVRVGTLNYVTGVVQFYASFTVPVYGYGYQVSTINGWSDVGVSALGSIVDADLQFVSLIGAHYYPSAAAGASKTVTLHPSVWQCQIPVPTSASVTSDLLPASVGFAHADVSYIGAADGTLKALPVRDYNYLGNANIGTIDRATGMVRIVSELLPAPREGGFSNGIAFTSSLAQFPSLGVDRGVFRTQNFPLLAGNFQFYAGAKQAIANSMGTFSGDFSGSIDYKFGVVRWQCSTRITAADIRYNAVALISVPIDINLIGIDTARLPSDGRVPIFHKGDIAIVHNSQAFTLPAPIQKGVAIPLGRTNVNSVQVRDFGKMTVPASCYTVDLAAGEIVFLNGVDTSSYPTPWAVENTIKDMVLVVDFDISGHIKLGRALSRDYSAGTSYISTALPFSDLFSRSYGDFAQQAWLGTWSDERVGNEILANFNGETYPILVNNTGAIRERWAFIFTSTTAFRCIGQSVGQIGIGSTTSDFSPLNPATNQPYFTIRASGWGAGWSTGNVLRFNTDAAGAPFWIARTTLQGQAQANEDEFRVVFFGNVNRA